MGSQEFVVRLAHPNGKFIGRFAGDDELTADGSVIEVGGRRWQPVETLPGDPGSAVLVVVPESRPDH